MRFYRRSEADAWKVDFWHNGRRFRRSAGTRDRKAAQEWADKCKAEFWREDRLGQRPAVTWDAAVLDWLETHQHLRALSDRKDQLRWASKYLRGRRLDTIDRAELDHLGKLKSRQGAANGTVNRHLAAISAILGHARKKEWLAAMPSIPRRREAATRLVWATQEQARKLVDALPAHWQPIAEFSLATGMRRFNATHLEWSAVDLRHKVAWVHADEAKGGRVISIPLSDAAIALLREQKGKHKVYVFPGERRTPVSRIEHKIWTVACKAAGLKSFRWHDLRHTWASWHAQNGTDLRALMELGGWSSLAMVMRYAHLAPSHVARFAGNAGLARNRAGSKKSGKPKKAA